MPGPTVPTVPPEEFRRLMGRWATGVSVVTGSDGTVDVGLTVNALLSVALEPPLLLVSLTESADSTPVIRSSRRFAANFLAVEQRPWSERFAQPIESKEKFRGVPTHRGALGLPLLDGCLGYAECEVREEFPLADHRLFIGEVVHTEAGRPSRPLVYFQGRYAEALGATGLTFPPPRE